MKKGFTRAEKMYLLRVQQMVREWSKEHHLKSPEDL